MRKKKTWTLNILLIAPCAALILGGALILRWALSRDQALELVAGALGAGLCWLVALVALCLLWTLRRPPSMGRPEDVTWPWLKKRLDPYYGVLFSQAEKERESGAVERFFRRHFGLEPSPLMVWIMPAYLFIRMAESCAEEGDWSSFLHMRKSVADLICERLSALDCFEEGRKLQYLRALGPEEGTNQCLWFAERLPHLRQALTDYVKAHFDEFVA